MLGACQPRAPPAALGGRVPILVLVRRVASRRRQIASEPSVSCSVPELPSVPSVSELPQFPSAPSEPSVPELPQFPPRAAAPSPGGGALARTPRSRAQLTPRPRPLRPQLGSEWNGHFLGGTTAFSRGEGGGVDESPLGRALVVTGPWLMNGLGPILFFRHGRVSSPWGLGHWTVEGQASVSSK